MKKTNTITETLLTATDGLVGSITDLLLVQIFALVRAGSVRTFWDAERAFEDIQQMHDTVNYKTIKSAFYQLTKHGFVHRSPKRSTLDITITKAGITRIEELLPTYHSDRPWDGHIYLISYDIPTKTNTSRNILRTYIKATGGALLQESLWLNPYNPTVLLEQFAKDHAINGRILVSRLGTDGTIGEESLPSLIQSLYHYDALADDYNTFIATYTNKKHISLFSVTLDFNQILHRDPQLPFPLEPKNFPARRAYDVFLSLKAQSPK